MLRFSPENKARLQDTLVRAWRWLNRDMCERVDTWSIIQSQLSVVWQRHCSRSLLIALYFIAESTLPQSNWWTTMALSPPASPLTAHNSPPPMVLSVFMYVPFIHLTQFSLSLSFSFSFAPQFDKAYAYSIRHMFGKEGKRTDYTPYSCMKVILSNPPSQGDFHGEQSSFKNESRCSFFGGKKKKAGLFGIRTWSDF